MDTEGSTKKLSRTISIVVKMRNKKIIEVLNSIIKEFGIKAKMYTWVERGKPIHAVLVAGKTEVKDFLSLIKPLNKFFHL